MGHVLNRDTAIYRYLMLLRGGARITVYTKDHGPARTNRVASLEREDDTFGDWRFLERPASADSSILPETFGRGIISARDLADALDSNPELWAEVME